MSYIVLARKWRPQSFSELLGQDHIKQTLVNAISSGRVAHAYLLCGIRGSGKTTTARLIAKALNCLEGPTPNPCNICANCVAITNSLSSDVLEIDAASNRGIDEIRSIKENVKYLPGSAKYKVYIIDEVHMLTVEAFNALLKTIEEPPPQVIFILATTDPHKVPLTISSRCQPLDFRPVDYTVLKELIEKICREEKVMIEKDACDLVINHAGGSFRDAVSLIDQLIAYTEGKITKDSVIAVLGQVDKEQCNDLVTCIISKDIGQSIKLVHELIQSGVDEKDIIENLINMFRDLLIKHEFESNTKEEKNNSITYEELDQILMVLMDSYGRIVASEFSRLILELTIIRLCKIRPINSLDRLIAKIENVAECDVRHDRVEEIQSPKVENPVKKENIRVQKTSDFDWNEFVKKISVEKPNVGSCLTQSYFLNFDGKRVSIGFAKNSFYFDRINNEATKEILRSSLQSFYGKELDIAFSVVEKEANLVSHEGIQKIEVEKRHAETKEKLKNHPSVSEILESFGGEIIEVEEVHEK